MDTYIILKLLFISTDHVQRIEMKEIAPSTVQCN